MLHWDSFADSHKTGNIKCVLNIDSMSFVVTAQEKRYQSLEGQRQLQELTFVKEEKKQLANELQALRSKDQQLRDRIGKLEAILHKVALVYLVISTIIWVLGKADKSLFWEHLCEDLLKHFYEEE